LFTFDVHTLYLYIICVSLLICLVLTDLRLRVDYKHTDEETSKQLSDRHVAIGNAVLKGNTVSDEQNFGCEGQCLNSAFEKLREGMQNIDSL